MGQKKLINYVQKFVSLTEIETELFCESFKKVKVKKKQFIVQPNFTDRHRNFVIKGVF